MRIGKIVSDAKYRMNEQFQNFLIFGVLEFSKLKRKLKFQKFII